MLSPESRLSEIILRECHEGPVFSPVHWSAADCLVRSQRYGYIVKGFQAAKQICSACTQCNIKEAEACTQRMGQLPKDVLLLAPPFTNVSVDLCGMGLSIPLQQQQGSPLRVGRELQYRQLGDSPS